MSECKLDPTLERALRAEQLAEKNGILAHDTAIELMEARKQRDELQIMNDQLCEAVEKTFPKIESIVKQRDELLAALQILTIACEMDYCSDDTEIGEMRCDDDECVALGVDGDRNSFITFGMIRLAKQAIANVKGETE